MTAFRIFLIIASVLLLLFALYLFMIAPRRNHSLLQHLRKYRYAHRGLHSLPDARPCVPENSLAAFRAAAEHGFGAELDVHFTKDLKLAVVHDSDLKRVTGQHEFVEDLTFNEVQRLRLYGTDERIPSLSEVLPIFEKSGTPLIVEIKTAHGNWASLTADTVACLEKYRVIFCIESFDPHVILWLKKNRPDIVRGQLSMHYRKESGVGAVNRFFLTNLLYDFLTRPDFIAYHFEARRNLSCRLCRTLLGGQAVSWTIRRREDMQAAEKEGSLVIFENFLP